jgi:hypothetical protein
MGVLPPCGGSGGSLPAAIETSARRIYPIATCRMTFFCPIYGAGAGVFWHLALPSAVSGESSRWLTASPSDRPAATGAATESSLVMYRRTRAPHRQHRFRHTSRLPATPTPAAALDVERLAAMVSLADALLRLVWWCLGGERTNRCRRRLAPALDPRPDVICIDWQASRCAGEKWQRAPLAAQNSATGCVHIAPSRIFYRVLPGHLRPNMRPRRPR